MKVEVKLSVFEVPLHFPAVMEQLETSMASF